MSFESRRILWNHKPDIVSYLDICGENDQKSSFKSEPYQNGLHWNIFWISILERLLSSKLSHEMLYAIWYLLHNLKKVKKHPTTQNLNSSRLMIPKSCLHKLLRKIKNEKLNMALISYVQFIS